MGPKNQRNHYPLPEADRISWDEVSRRASNFGLLFQRMIGYPKRWAIDGDEKKRMWDRLVQENGNQIFRDKPFQALYAAVAERRKTLFKDLEGSGCRVRSFELRLEERLSIGFGTESALETGITLHRLYGMPYLPGSAIKGVTRHHRFFEIAERIGVRPLMPKEIERRKSARRPTPWKLLETILTTRIPEEGKAREEVERTLERAFEDLRNDPEVEGALGEGGIRLEDLRGGEGEDFRRIFGATDSQGKIVFFDAFPSIGVGGNLLEIDIINTHHQQYYTGKTPQPPADWESPVPVYFATVTPGRSFGFVLAGRDENLLRTAERWVRTALAEAGIGSKTNSGYGYFQGGSSGHAQMPGSAPDSPSAAYSPKLREALLRLEKVRPDDAGTIGTIAQIAENLPDPQEAKILKEAILKKVPKKRRKKYKEKWKM